MAFFKIDTEKALTQARRLNEYGSFVASERSNIYRSSENNSHPVGQVEEAARAYGSAPGASGVSPSVPAPSSPDGFSTQPDALGGDGSPTTLAGCVSAIIGLAAELNARTTEVINLNSNGIDNKNPDGTYSYYLPDPPEGTVDTAAYWASMDTSSNVHAYNTESAVNGKKQAQQLEAAINSGDEAKVDQVLAEIDKHRDVPAYGATFYKECGGPREYLNLVRSADQHFAGSPDTVLHVTNTLGHVLAGASQSSVGGDDLGREFAIEIARTRSGDDVAAFNGLTSAPGTVFGTGFLVGAADVLEDIDAGKISGGTGYLATEFSEDPLAGVLTGMGNNTKAALTYLGGNGSVDAEGNWVPDEETQKRWDRLTSRDWKNYGPSDNPKSWCSTGQDGFTAALAAASSYRNADSTHSNPESDARATYAAGQGIHYFGGDKWSKDDFSEAMQGSMATVIANSPEELSAAANGGFYKNVGNGPSLGNWGVQASDISSLVYRFGNNADAMATVSAAQANYHSDRINEAAASGGSATFGNKYRQAAATTAYLEQLSTMRCDDDIAQKNADAAAAQENKRKVVDTTVNVANTVLALGLSSGSGGTAAPAIHAIASNIAKPMTTDSIMHLLGSPEVAENNSASNSYNMTKARGYGIEINHDMVTGESSVPPDEYNKTGWFSYDENGKPHVDTQSLTPEQAAEMISWRNDCVVNNEDNLTLTQVDNATDGAATDADKQINPSAAAEDGEGEKEQAKHPTKPRKN